MHAKLSAHAVHFLARLIAPAPLGFERADSVPTWRTGQLLTLVPEDLHYALLSHVAPWHTLKVEVFLGSQHQHPHLLVHSSKLIE